MKKNQLSIILALLPLFDAVAANEIPAYAMEMNVKRIDEVLLRYTRFNSESPYPCFRLELIKPQKNWEIIDEKEICEMNGKPLDTGYSYSGFDSIEFKSDGVNFNFNYFDKNNPGEYTQRCSVSVIQKKIQAIECSNPSLSE
jgi:hypothetical protein